VRLAAASDRLRAAGSSPQAIAQHYDLPPEFFATWLGPDLVYSCGLWPPGDEPGDDALAWAQRAKIDHFATALDVAGKHVLDVGCGWGALALRFAGVHGAASVVGLTLSRSQCRHAAARAAQTAPDVEVRLESWLDHEPLREYDAVTCIEMAEHLASDLLDPDAKVDVYREFFAALAGWLRPGGLLGLQAICLDGVSHAGSRPGRGPMSELIRTSIFPEAMSAAPSELVLGWEPHFSLRRLDVGPQDYRRTFRAWRLGLARRRDLAASLVPGTTLRTVERYLAAGEVMFRLGEQSLYRVVLQRRDRPKSWASPLTPGAVAHAAAGAGRPGPWDRPSGRPAAPRDRQAAAPRGATAAAVQAHYDVSNEFFGLWLGPSMMYSSGLWTGPDHATDPSGTPDLTGAVHRKIDYFLDALRLPPGGRLLDVGCGWGGTATRALERDPGLDVVGLTLSPAQRDFCAARAQPCGRVRLEPWEAHEPGGPDEAAYDGVVSFGAFEHFARDGSTSVQRVLAYRAFFARCHVWLVPGGRLGLETIAHDDAPDTAAPRGRGPLADAVQDLFPQSLAPHLAEIVLGYEPWFALEVLRSDAADFARTFRTWTVQLRAAEAEAARIVGQATTRAFLRYLAASQVQFRTGALTNYRLVLHRRDEPHEAPHRAFGGYIN